MPEDDGDRSLTAMRQAAETGDGQGMHRYALELLGSDPADALRWFEMAAQKGNVDAMVGYAYQMEADDPEDARRWYRRAAELDNTYALRSLGHMLYLHDPDAARASWERAADLGDVQAMVNLGWFLWSTDRGASEHWLRRGSEAGDTQATTLLARRIRFRHPKQAAGLFDQAAAAGDPGAMAEVGNRIVRHNLLLIFKRPSSRAFQQAIDMLTPAAEAADPLGMRELASLLIVNGRREDGERWLEKLAASGVPSGSLLLGVHHLGGGRHAQAEAAFASGKGQLAWRFVFLLGRLLARRRRGPIQSLKSDR